MNEPISANTQAILLLTAPLLTGGSDKMAEILTLSEYKQLVKILRGMDRQPADLLEQSPDTILDACAGSIEPDRIRKLLQRGFQLSRAIDRWQARSIWVVSRADAGYPKRFKTKLMEDSPPIIYGCGSESIFDWEGLAVVGSRNVNDDLISYTEAIGRSVAKARFSIISGGARGIDRAAMQGALRSGGCVVGVLAEGLEKAALSSENRKYLQDKRLVLVSQYDPLAGFNVGHAMQRNKLIYALSHAALVVNADLKSGGTWAGAVEQLDKLQMVPIYIRSTGERSEALIALHERGAIPWPNPSTDTQIEETIINPVTNNRAGMLFQDGMISSPVASAPVAEVVLKEKVPAAPVASAPIAPPTNLDGKPEVAAAVLEEKVSAAASLFAKVLELAQQIEKEMSEAEISEYLGVCKPQAKAWIQRLVSDGVLVKKTKPIRYSRV
jgi:DNA processing protein